MMFTKKKPTFKDDLLRAVFINAAGYLIALGIARAVQAGASWLFTPGEDD